MMKRLLLALALALCVTACSKGRDGLLGSVTSTVAPVYAEDNPTAHGLIEWNGQPAFFSTANFVASGSVNVVRIVPNLGGTINTVVVNVTTLGSGMTAATTTSVTGAANNGSGLIRLAVTSSASFATNDVATVSGVGGTTEANGAWLITVIDSTHVDLGTSAFVHAWTSGGTLTRSANAAAIYDQNGNMVGATGDQVSAWGAAGTVNMALAGPSKLAACLPYYVALLFNGTGSTLSFSSAAGMVASNPGLSTSTLRWGTQGTGATKLPTSLTVSSITASSGSPAAWWVGLK